MYRVTSERRSAQDSRQQYKRPEQKDFGSSCTSWEPVTTPRGKQHPVLARTRRIVPGISSWGRSGDDLTTVFFRVVNRAPASDPFASAATSAADSFCARRADLKAPLGASFPEARAGQPAVQCSSSSAPGSARSSVPAPWPMHPPAGGMPRRPTRVRRPLR